MSLGSADKADPYGKSKRHFFKPWTTSCGQEIDRCFFSTTEILLKITALLCTPVLSVGKGSFYYKQISGAAVESDTMKAQLKMVC